MTAPTITIDLLRARLEEKIATGEVPDDPELRQKFEAVVNDPIFGAALARDNAARPGAPQPAPTPAEDAPADPTPPTVPINTVPVRDDQGVIVGWEDVAPADTPAPEDDETIAAPGYRDPGSDAPEEWAAVNTAPSMSVLEEAGHVVGGARAQDYGENSLPQIAAMWSAYLGTPITGRQVSWMMVQLKAVRDLHRPKRDNQVDGAGYIALGAQCP